MCYTNLDQQKGKDALNTQMKILVVHTGGTISCEDKFGKLSPSKNITPYFKELQKDLRSVKFVHKRLTPFLSENLNGTHLNRIAEEIKKGISSEQPDGVIVTHGSDTIAYTGAFLSYAFGLSIAPVVLVCADLPLSDSASTGHINIRAAIALIQSNTANGVYAVYKDGEHSATVHRASRLLSYRSYEKELTSCSNAYGKINLIKPENPILVKSPLYCEADDAIIIDLPKLKKNSNIHHLTVYPGMKCSSPPMGCKAVILGTYHSGTIDTSNPQLQRLSRICKKRGISLFTDGTTNGSTYESMNTYGKLDITQLPALSSPCAMYIKLWILSEKSSTDLKKDVFLSCGGDIIPLK